MDRMSKDDKRLEYWLKNVPVEDRQRLENALRAGEHIRWATRPRRMPALWRIGVEGLVARLIISTFFLGGVVGLGFLAEKAAARGTGVLLFVGGGFAFMLTLWLFSLWEVFRPWREQKLARRCFYVVTNERALVHEAGGVKAYALSGVPCDVRRSRGGRGGDIIWDRVAQGKEEPIPLGFIHLVDLDEALAQLNAAATGQECAGQEAPADKAGNELGTLAAHLPQAPAALLVQLVDALPTGEHFRWAGKPQPYWVQTPGPWGLAHWLIPLGLVAWMAFGATDVHPGSWAFALLLAFIMAHGHAKTWRYAKRAVYALSDKYLYLTEEAGRGQHDITRLPLAGCRYRVREWRKREDIIIIPGGETPNSMHSEPIALRKLAESARLESLLQELGVGKE